MKSGHILFMWLLASAPSLSAWAGETAKTDDGDLVLHGFGTLGIARSDSDQAQFVRDLSQPDGLTDDWSGKIDSMIGVQADYRFNEQLEGVVQAIARYRYDGGYRPEISWAFLRYDPDPSLSLRAGRLGTEFYMQADSRLVGYANPTVRPPPDYYGPLVFSYLDGIDAGKTMTLGDGLLRGKLFAGISPESTPFVEGVTWDLSGSLLAGGHLDYLVGPWQVRLGHAQVRFGREVPLAALGQPDPIAQVPELSMRDTWTRFDSLGVVYDQGPLQVQLMLSQTEHESAAYEDSRAGYAIAAYRIDGFTPYLGYSRVESSPNRFSPPVPPQLVRLTAISHSDQHTWFLGSRWDFRENMALKAQVDWVRGSKTSVFPFRADVPAWDGDMTVVSLSLDFVF